MFIKAILLYESLWGSMGSLWGSMGYYGVLWGKKTQNVYEMGYERGTSFYPIEPHSTP